MSATALHLKKLTDLSIYLSLQVHYGGVPLLQLCEKYSLKQGGAFFSLDSYNKLYSIPTIYPIVSNYINDIICRFFFSFCSDQLTVILVAMTNRQHQQTFHLTSQHTWLSHQAPILQWTRVDLCHIPVLPLINLLA